MANLKTLNECLWLAFVQDGWNDESAQNPQQMWAIMEGMERMKFHIPEWKRTHARKAHECIRGCEIRPGEYYFQRSTDYSWGSEIKFCASCLAMAFYIADVSSKPAVFNTHFDVEKVKPVNPEAEETWRRNWEKARDQIESGDDTKKQSQKSLQRSKASSRKSMPQK